MRFYLFALPLLASTMASAQATVQTPRTSTLNHTYPLGQPSLNALNRQGCPVGMAAEQKATGATQWVVSLEDSRNPSAIPPGKMGVHVSLKAPVERNFRSAQVEVAYMVPPAGMMLVDGKQSTETKTFDLPAGDEPTLELERSLLIGAGVSITRVKLVSLTNPDGTVWHPDATSNCSVKVSHFLPVAAR